MSTPRTLPLVETGEELSKESPPLRLAAGGLRLFPVESRGKKPLIADWPHQATTDEKRLASWYQQFPGCNSAIAARTGVRNFRSRR